ncbi:MAG: VWA domain-containing protein [Xanthobacteraceae bacterium]|nr:MAG: VWA domain-containing protein [Xanthobacteraceae bacterium]
MVTGTRRIDLSRLAAALLRAERGNVATTFAIAFLPIIGFIGAAVDYSRANNARSAMQVALDSTALMLSKDAATLTPAQLTQKATAYFSAMYSHPEAQNVTIAAAYTASGSNGATVKLDGAGFIGTDFMKVVGFPQLPFNSSSTAAWGNTRLRVALALDNTGSMAANGKMTALKTAAKNLIDQLKGSARTPGDVYISVIPFAKDVNVDPANRNQGWLRWDQWDNQNGACSFGGYSSRNSCQSHGGSWTPGNHASWTGCVTDRDQNYDTNAAPPIGGTLASQFVTEQYADCPTALMPLSYDWSGLKARIDAMSPDGNTNQGIGMAWAWLSLAPAAPLNAPAEDANYAYKKVIILLSDGLNTQNRWYSNAAQIDARQALLCANAKAAGITVYAIQVNTTGDPTQAVMQNCASGPDKFFLLTNASQVISTFDSIGASLSKLRLAR